MENSKSKIEKFVLAGCIAGIAMVMFKAAWLGDDAYITFRVVDNFVNGYGLVWNISERVQVFTHPLWTLLLTVPVFFTRDVYFTSIFLSLVLAISAVVIAVLKIADNTKSLLIVLAVLLTSKAFIEYSTSGLENPLSYLLLAVFYRQFFKGDLGLKNLFGLSLTASLVAMNRLDTLLFCLPALAYVYWHNPKIKGLSLIAAGFTPLLLWFSFSLVYYGFLLPNTYYAKLKSGVPSFDLMLNGFNYYASTITRDPITMITILGGIFLAWRMKEAKKIAAALGIVLYLLYVFRIGGDFMSGRFFAAALFGAAMIISTYQFKFSPKKTGIIIGAVLLLGVFMPYGVLLSGPKFGLDRDNLADRFKTTDERRYYFQSTGLISNKEYDGSNPFRWMAAGREWRTDSVKVKAAGSIGFIGYLAGPETHIIDGYALTDPFLARMPACNLTSWRIGHYIRTFPEGYRATLETSQNQFADSSLGEYYGRLKKVISGEIWNAERFKEIWNFNLGKYDKLMEQGLKSMTVKLDGPTYFSLPVNEGDPWDSPQTVAMTDWGVRVALNDKWHFQGFQIALDGNDVYSIRFFDDSVLTGETRIEKSSKRGGLRFETILAPVEVYRRGYDFIEIRPIAGDGNYSAAYIVPVELIRPE